MIKIFWKFERQIKNYQKIAKIRVFKILITIRLTLETMKQLNIKPWGMYPWAPGARKTRKNLSKTWKLTVNSKISSKKLQSLKKNLLKFVKLKSWKRFQYISKLCSNLLKTLVDFGSFALEALNFKANWKKFLKFLEKGFIKNMLKFVILKSWKLFYGQQTFLVACYQLLKEVF